MYYAACTNCQKNTLNHQIDCLKVRFGLYFTMIAKIIIPKYCYRTNLSSASILPKENEEKVLDPVFCRTNVYHCLENGKQTMFNYYLKEYDLPALHT